MTKILGRNATDIGIVCALVVLTTYSAVSFYHYIFPKTLCSISRECVNVDPYAPLDVLNWIGFAVSAFLLMMFVWAYASAVMTSPGRIPAVFKYEAPGSANLALAAFYDPEQLRNGGEAGRSGSSASTNAGKLRASEAEENNSPTSTSSDDTSCSSSNSSRDEHSSPGVAHKTVVPARAPKDNFIFNRRENCYTSVTNKNLRFCPLCTTYKPPRAHHCSHCKFCVLKYDHHCPWLAQCVGFFNYKNYLLTLLYGAVLTAWSLLLLTVALCLHLLHRFTEGPEATGVLARLLAVLDVGPPTFGVFVCFCESLLFLIMTGFLLQRHIQFARRNITTIDVVIFEQELRYDRGLMDSSDESEEDADGAAEESSSHTRRRKGEKKTIFNSRNKYDLGVRTNLLQIFGDAARPAPRCGDGEAQSYYQQMMEGREFQYNNFALRWFWRLLPLPAYPRQKIWRNPRRSDSRNYGSTDVRTAPSGTGSGGRRSDNDIVVDERSILGLRYPVKEAIA